MEKGDILDRVFHAVENVTGISEAEIMSRSRDRNCHFARMIVAYHLRASGLTLGDIGTFIGNRRESTVIYLLSAYQKETTPYFRSCADKVMQILNSSFFTR